MRAWVLPVGGGLLAGLVAGLFGVGGGLLLVPLLAVVLGRAQHVAHATSLVAIVLPATVATARFAVADAVAWAAAAAVAVGALAGTQLGAGIMERVPPRILRLLFAAVLVAMTVRLLVAADAGVTRVGGVEPLRAWFLAAHVGLGVVAGTASALLGIGGGALIVPGLVILLGYGQHVAEGTSLAIIVPTALVGAASHARRGYTDWGLGMKVGTGGMAGALLGAELALDLPAAVLSRAFGVLLAVVAVGLLLREHGRDGNGRVSSRR